MKLTTLVTGIFAVAASGALAADKHVIPTAPADYLSMTNPSTGNKTAIASGEKIYAKRCEKCHGPKGDGLGKSAKDLSPPVAAFTNGYLKDRKDGQLFWIIDKGSPNTDMDAYGPGTNFNLSKDDVWAVISYMRSKFK